MANILTEDEIKHRLDELIVFWRGKRDKAKDQEGLEFGAEMRRRDADCYVAALQMARTALVGTTLEAE